ncbi:MAG: cob(I)yrinic acid a,c-diamide adenosyltransferase [Actinomycetia bacterium]|nr:cob(I)yrinic acid a,c-diamide adenosyltransferase [Actinomycetes bacterium]
MQKKGLVIINTGEGKGKTTAAFGLALRAAGHNRKVLILQFIKGPWVSGEIKAASYIPQIEVKQLGSGFIPLKQGKPVLSDKLREEAGRSIHYTRQMVESGKYDVVILDEINNMVDYGLISPETVAEIIEEKPRDVVLVLTGRNAHPRIVELADTVTDMKQVKHAFENGIKAIKGIEY